MAQGVPKRKSNILDVAERAGVSRTSVSNYFHRPHKLSLATRERIREAMDELEFAPNEAARTLRTGRTPVVGYLAFELASARTPRIANAIGDTLAEGDLAMLLATDWGDARREQEYLQLFERQRLSGVIVSSVVDIEDDLARLRTNGMPSVLAGRQGRRSDQPSVAVDHVQGGRLAAQHVLSMGRRRLAFITDSVDIPQIADRLRGAREEVASVAGASLEIIRVPRRDVEGGKHGGETLLGRNGANRPDAILCVNDLVAIGATHVLAGRVDIPSEVAIVGYDDTEFAACNRIPLTSIWTPQEELGFTAARLLLGAIADARSESPRQGLDQHPAAEQVLFEPHLVIRESTVS